jgi:hypothetical protein
MHDCIFSRRQHTYLDDWYAGEQPCTLDYNQGMCLTHGADSAYMQHSRHKDHAPALMIGMPDTSAARLATSNTHAGLYGATKTVQNGAWSI